MVNKNPKNTSANRNERKNKTKQSVKSDKKK